MFKLLLCGVLLHVTSALPSQIRIVGGQDANIVDYPYQVSVMIDSSHACGGSILSVSYILSAAHCFVEESRVAHITIRAGSSARTSGGQVVTTKTLKSHNDFDPDTYDYDVAVLQLATNLVFGTGVAAIKLPTSTTTFTDGQTSTATGWGLTSDKGNLADILQMVAVPLLNTGTCQTTSDYGSAVSARMICAGSAGKDTCGGDSGGPLVTNGVQIGIVSWGDVCGEARTPGVYTKVPEVLSFINGIIT